MKFQVAAWWFHHQGYRRTRQCSLGAPAVPDMHGARQWICVSLAEAQRLPESAKLFLRIQNPAAKTNTRNQLLPIKANQA